MKRIIAVTALAAALVAGWFAGERVASAPIRRPRMRVRGRINLHLSDAPGIPQRPSRKLPGLWHGARGTTPGRDGRAASAGNSAVPRGSVHVHPDRQQAIGVRVGVVNRMAATRVLRTTGRVAADENRTYPIVAAVTGWIRNVESVATGDTVEKDQVLASFLAPELEFRNAQQSYYTGLEAFYRLAVTEPQPQPQPGSRPHAFGGGAGHRPHGG